MKPMVISAFLLLASGAAEAAEHSVSSPNGQVQVTISDAGGLSWSARHNGSTIFSQSSMGIELDTDERIGPGLQFARVTRRPVADAVPMQIGKTNRLVTSGRELAADLMDPKTKRRMTVLVRAYDDGIAFRYILPDQTDTGPINIRNEITSFDFAKDYRCWGLNNGTFGTNHEGEFDPVQSSTFREHNLYDLPLLCETGSGAFAIAESDLRDWSALNLTGKGNGRLGVSGRLTPTLENRRLAVRTRLGAPIASPWRIVMMGPNAGKLIESNLVAALSEAPAQADWSWVKPGKTAWDWWNGPVVRGVRNSGMNEPTMKRFIDFAASNKFEYMLIDEGWHAGAGGGGVVRPGADVTRPLPQLNLPELVRYAGEKGVGLWLWVNWQALDAQMEEALALYSRWGIKGIKVDFMDRDDQAMVAWHHKLLSAAARHRLMVNLHGAYHPAGLNRTYPNLLTTEAVLGAEYNKWSQRVTATHNVTLPFTRMLGGPMDYTPGGFRNVTSAQFTPRNELPFVQHTRAHGLAMYVVYESPLSLVSDSPDTYAESPDGLDIIRDVPVVWDETRFLMGGPGEYIVLARRKGNDWWVGAMNNEQARTVRVPLSFLARPASAQIVEDGGKPTELRRRAQNVGARDVLTLNLAGSGGAVVRIPQSGN